MKKVIKYLFCISVIFLVSISFAQTDDKLILKYDPIFNTFGYLDQSKKEIIAEKYQYAEKFIDYYAIVGMYNKFGIINELGEIILPIEYNSINILKGGKAILMKNYKWEIAYLNSKTITPLDYDYIGYFSQKSEWVAPFKRDTLFGIMDTNLREIFIENCDIIFNFSEGIAVYKFNDYSGYISKNGNKITPPIYYQLENFHNGKAFFIRDSLFGFIDKNGEEICKYRENFTYDYNIISDSLQYYVILDETETVINTNCEIFNEKFLNDKLYANYYLKLSDINSHICDVSGDFLLIMKDKKFGIYDLFGNEIIPIIYKKIRWSWIETFIVEKENKFGLYNNNKIVLDIKYDAISYSGLSHYNLIYNGKNGIANKYGEIIVPIIYDVTYPSVSNNMIKVELTGIKKLVGYYNVLGELKIPLQFEDGKDFQEGLAAVKMNGKWGFINIEGNVVIPFEYDSVISFHINRSLVMKNGLWGVINEKGYLIAPIKYLFIDGFKDGISFVVSKNSYGLIDFDGKKICNFFSKISSVFFINYNDDYDFWDFYNNEKKITLNKKGQII